MALELRQLQFFVDRINASDMRTFGGTTAHLFTYLKDSIKDNPVFEQYDKLAYSWNDINQYFNQTSSFPWTMPTSYDDAKKFSYILYRLSSSQGEGAYSVPNSMFGKKSINDSIREFNSTFLPLLG